jgi:hypothetical protein
MGGLNLLVSQKGRGETKLKWDQLASSQASGSTHTTGLALRKVGSPSRGLNMLLRKILRKTRLIKQYLYLNIKN